MAKKVCVILSGCGYLDGAEIHEAVCTLLALEQHGAAWSACAPNVKFEVVDHNTGEPTGEQRNAIAESSRISRGECRDIKDVRHDAFDALVMPGGFGAAKNLSNFASAGKNAEPHPEVARLISEFITHKKPIGAICIAPATLATVLSQRDILAKLTVGNQTDHAEPVQAIRDLGIEHVDCAVEDAVLDETHKIASTPAYMLGPSVLPVSKGIEKVVAAVLKWA